MRYRIPIRIYIILVFILVALPSLTSVVQCRNVTNTTVLVMWNEWNPEEDLGEGPVKSYTVVYGEIGGQVNRSFNCTGNTTSLTLTKLKASTDYFVGVQVARHGPGGIGPLSAVSQFRTLCTGECRYEYFQPDLQ